MFFFSANVRPRHFFKFSVFLVAIQCWFIEFFHQSVIRNWSFDLSNCTISILSTKWISSYHQFAQFWRRLEWQRSPRANLVQHFYGIPVHPIWVIIVKLCCLRWCGRQPLRLAVVLAPVFIMVEQPEDTSPAIIYPQEIIWVGVCSLKQTSTIWSPPERKFSGAMMESLLLQLLQQLRQLRIPRLRQLRILRLRQLRIPRLRQLRIPRLRQLRIPRLRQLQVWIR